MVDSVVLPTPPFGLATTITGMRPSRVLGFAGMLAALVGRRHPELPAQPVHGLTRTAAADDAERHARSVPRSSSSSPIPSSSNRASTGACSTRRARCRRVAAPGRLEVRDLYALYPDYLIDVAAEQAALAAARLVVWQHPIHWYGMPPLMKLWLDEVLAFGWAYGPGGTALRGKDLWLVATHRRPRGLVPARQLQPLLLRRLPAALRADRGALRHALPAAAAAARRAQGERGRARRPRRDLRAARSPSYPRLARARARSRTASPARCRATRGRSSNVKEAASSAMEHGAWLTGSLVYLAAAVLAVPLARFLGLGSIIGYLGAGILIGPWGLKLVTDPRRCCTSPSSASC